LIRRRKNNRVQQRQIMPVFRFNETISAPEVRVIDESVEEGADKNLGVMKTIEAIELAREKGLDLVEVAGEAVPPVAKIISFDKYRYSHIKKEKQQIRAKSKGMELRHIRITPRVATNDLEVKMKKMLAFLEKGDKVEIQLFLKGREKANKDFAREKLVSFLSAIAISYKVTSPIKVVARGFAVQIIKN